MRRVKLRVNISHLKNISYRYNDKFYFFRLIYISLSL